MLILTAGQTNWTKVNLTILSLHVFKMCLTNTVTNLQQPYCAFWSQEDFGLELAYCTAQQM